VLTFAWTKIMPRRTANQDMNADSTTARPAATKREREEVNVVFWWKKLTECEQLEM
jgi:hypothetical protein